jgi:hypothetical protein
VRFTAERELALVANAARKQLKKRQPQQPALYFALYF